MTYSLIEEKLNQGKTIILDGGIGGELQKLGAKMDKGLWCGRCSIDSPNEFIRLSFNKFLMKVFVLLFSQSLGLCNNRPSKLRNFNCCRDKLKIDFISSILELFNLGILEYILG